MELVLPELLCELHHHRRDGAGGGRPRGPPPGRHPLLSLLSQGDPTSSQFSTSQHKCQNYHDC